MFETVGRTLGGNSAANSKSGLLSPTSLSPDMWKNRRCNLTTHVTAMVNTISTSSKHREIVSSKLYNYFFSWWQWQWVSNYQLQRRDIHANRKSVCRPRMNPDSSVMTNAASGTFLKGRAGRLLISSASGCIFHFNTYISNTWKHIAYIIK